MGVCVERRRIKINIPILAKQLSHLEYYKCG